MQKIFNCSGDVFGNIELQKINMFLEKFPEATVISVTPYFEPIQSPNTFHKGNYGAIIVVNTNALD